MRVALGLYTVYDALTANLERTLFDVRKMGYEGVEFYGPCIWRPKRVKKALKDSGVEICGWHVAWNLLSEEERKKTFLLQSEIGNPAIVIPCLGGPWNVGHRKEDDCQEIWEFYAEQISRIAEEAEAFEMRLGYHTHAHEFEREFTGKTPWEIFLEKLDWDVFLELDTGNCLEGGGDPVKALSQAAGRLYTVHCKPFGRKMREQAELGSEEDDNPWKDIFGEAEYGGAVWMAVEDEAEAEDRLKLAERDRKAIGRLMERIKEDQRYGRKETQCGRRKNG